MSQPEPTLEAVAVARRMQQAAVARAEVRAAKDAAAPRPTAKIVQFPLPFPEETPPVSNVIARSALFAAVKSKDRRIMKDEVVASQDGIQISFTGEQFNQDDHDTFMQLVKLASGRPLGETVIVPANAILRILGRSTGKSQHEQLRADLKRLFEGSVVIKTKDFGSSLFCVGGMHNRWVSWFGGLANRVVRRDARH